MSKVKVIVVNGLSRSGKDSFIKAVCKKVIASEVHSTIDTVKKSLILGGMLDPLKKGPEEREFLMVVKKAWINYNDGPLNEVIFQDY